MRFAATQGFGSRSRAKAPQRFRVARYQPGSERPFDSEGLTVLGSLIEHDPVRRPEFCRDQTGGAVESIKESLDIAGNEVIATCEVR